MLYKYSETPTSSELHSPQMFKLSRLFMNLPAAYQGLRHDSSQLTLLVTLLVYSCQLGLAWTILSTSTCGQQYHHHHHQHKW